MSEKPTRFQFRLRTLVAASLAVGLTMLLNLKPTHYNIPFRSEMLDWYGWPMPAYELTTYPGSENPDAYLITWNTLAIWIDSITAILILYVAIRIVGRRKPTTPAASMP